MWVDVAPDDGWHELVQEPVAAAFIDTVYAAVAAQVAAKTGHPTAKTGHSPELLQLALGRVVLRRSTPTAVGRNHAIVSFRDRAGHLSRGGGSDLLGTSVVYGCARASLSIN